MRKITDLVSVGPSVAGDLARIGITRVEQLVGQNPQELYERICIRDHVIHNICLLDVLHAAVAQAEDPDLPAHKCQWWYWTKVRKKN